MTDYIKREDAINVLKHGFAFARSFGVNRCLGMIRDIPSADVAEVVRCKDCKYNCTDDCAMIHGQKMYRNLFDDDFCSYGERKEP